MATSVSLDVAGQFPILGRPGLVYLDSAATAQTPTPVLDAMDRIYRESNANIHRGVYPLAQEATEAFEGARRVVADWIGSSVEETIFTKNATEAINLVAYSWGRRNVSAGDRVLITEMEHHSNIVPWQLLCAEVGAELRYVPVRDDFTLDLDALDRELASGVKLLAITDTSNVLGTVNPLSEIIPRAHDAGALVLVDGAQAVPHHRVDVRALDADFYAFTGHKVYGPTGIGVLYARRSLLEEMPPFLGGGDMISRVDFFESRWNALPWKFEAGTSPYVEAVGLGAAVGWLSSLGIAAVEEHESSLVRYALDRLGEVDGVSIIGPGWSESRGTAISFAVDGVHPHDVAEILARDGVCVRAGHHCAMPLMRALGVPATSRASIGVHNGTGDVDRLVDGLAEVKRIFADG
ncbi:MAG: cysteine desulfurase / selenocysteine lyase [Thermoleophilaceae bacterium]|jgi:cysteine desulfurase/selenocysteine lyase|nr:cysteine desulfurase / selenocysteine lyase [Thermoleophilaceae bacterium]